MKIVELTQHTKIAITNEEADLLNKFDEDTPVMARSDMDERQKLVANQLVNKNILFRKNEDNRIVYKRRPGKNNS